MTAVALIAALATAGDPDKPKAEPAVPGVAGNDSGKPALVLALRTSLGTNEAKILDSLTVIKNQLKQQNKAEPSWGEVKLYKSSKAGYEDVKAMVEGTGRKAAVDSSAGPALQQDPDAKEPEYRVLTPMASDTLTELRVTGKGGKDAKTFKPGPDPTVDPLYYNKAKDKYYFKPGLAFKGEAFAPESFALVVKRGQKEVALDAVPWAQDEYLFWILRLEDWKGSIEDLVKLFKNEADDVNGLQNTIALTARYTAFGVGSADSDDPQLEGQGFNNDRNLFQFVVPVSKALRKATTVWMKFPLTKKQAEDEAKKLNDLGFLKAITAIGGDKADLLVGGKWELEPKMVAKWVQLTRGTGEFGIEGVVKKVKDGDKEVLPVAGWKEQFNNGPVYRLVVYQAGEQALEFTTGKERTLVKVEAVINWTLHAPEKAAPPK